MPQIREQIAMVHLPPSKTLKYLFHVRKTTKKEPRGSFFVGADEGGERIPRTDLKAPALILREGGTAKVPPFTPPLHPPLDIPE